MAPVEQEVHFDIQRCNKHDIDLNTIIVKQTAMDLIVAEIKADLKQIKELLINRPTWMVTMMLSGLGALCVALLTCLIMLYGGHARL